MAPGEAVDLLDIVGAVALYLLGLCALLWMVDGILSRGHQRDK